MSNDFFPTIGSVAQEVDGETTEDGEELLHQIESLCMKCHEQGHTRMLLTSIPYFKEVIVASFQCDSCGNTNNEIQSAGKVRPEGTLYTAKILARSDLDRQLVRSSYCTVHIPQFELTLPGGRGQLTTVEGLVRDIVADLSTDQPMRLALQDPAYPKIQSIVEGLEAILDSGAEAMPPFTIQLDDPSGDSFVEFIGSMADPKWNLRTYKRTKAQNIQLGLVAADDESGLSEISETRTMDPEDSGELEDKNAEIFTFPGICSSCGHDLATYMKKVDIPYFKDIIIMSTNCNLCGYRDNEVKSGTAISQQGKRITLKVEDREDLSRDILKSETAGLSIPEIDLVLQPGTLGGRFTTLEGVLEQVYEELTEKVFTDGDASSTDASDGNAFTQFLASLKVVKKAERPFTLIIDDPLANSYVQNIYAPDPDPNMTIEMYDRTFEQNEELGLNDIKVEGYEEDVIAADASKPGKAIVLEQSDVDDVQKSSP